VPIRFGSSPVGARPSSAAAATAALVAGARPASAGDDAESQYHAALKAIAKKERGFWEEGADFFQEARLDKQSVVDRLAWSGATLYDLCTARMRACHKDRESRISLSDLFAEDVGREALVNALGQMAQPRDAFKLLYSAIREHCQRVGEEDQEFQVPRFILDAVRKEQAQRVSELQRGLSPG